MYFTVSHLDSIFNVCRSIPDFPKFLGIAMEAFLTLCDDTEADVRLVADECLNRTIKVKRILLITFCETFYFCLVHCLWSIPFSKQVYCTFCFLLVCSMFHMIT